MYWRVIALERYRLSAWIVAVGVEGVGLGVGDGFAVGVGSGVGDGSGLCDAGEVGEVIAASLTNPADLGLPFGHWTLDRLTAYLQEQKRVGIGRTRIGEILRAEGLRWRTHETWFGERVDPEFVQKRGRSSRSTRRHLRIVS